MNLKKNTELVFQQIADASQEANRALDAVSVIAVTKYVDVQTAEALLPLGVRHIGENRVDKFLEKYQALKDYPVTWHLIGTLQRRKVKEVIPYVDYFHALNSTEHRSCYQVSLAGQDFWRRKQAWVFNRRIARTFARIG